EHRNVVSSTWARQLAYPRFDRFLLLSSVAFDSSIAGICGTLTIGGCLYLPEQRLALDPAAIVQAICQHQISCLLCVPSLAHSLLHLASKKEFASLQTFIAAGERCPSELHARIEQLGLPIALYNEYGPTETAVWASYYPVTSHSLINTPIGRPIANTQIYLLD
ncbi:AMP-binding protein, partial [Chromobacterium amazonense]|uniref:AMP-binding protein n=1 Tax=Chromobacterium amazonense TaxID=1382803 RepID=UPI003F78B161